MNLFKDFYLDSTFEKLYINVIAFHFSPILAVFLNYFCGDYCEVL